MVMRYHWGSGIEHVYSHAPVTIGDVTLMPAEHAATSAPAGTSVHAATSTQATSMQASNPMMDNHDSPEILPDHDNDSDVDHPELDIEDQDDNLGEDHWEDESEVDYDDKELVAMDDMYGLSIIYDDYHD